jgi:hypothetical protein
MTSVADPAYGTASEVEEAVEEAEVRELEEVTAEEYRDG